MLGESVVVQRPVAGAEDPFGHAEASWVDEVVDNVLVAPGPRDDVVDSTRPNGVRVIWNLHFPGTFTGSLEHCRIVVRGGEPLSVIGDPQAYTPENVPGEWDRPVEVTRVDG